eukprot:895996-Amphidinium_carterae.2
MHEKAGIKITWCQNHPECHDKHFRCHVADRHTYCMSCDNPSTIKCGLCDNYMCKNCHCYCTSADTWSGFIFACLGHGGSPRMIYEKARFAGLRAYTHTIYRNDPMFPRNFGPFNDVTDFDPADEQQCWRCSPHDAGEDFTLQVENYNINFSRRPVFAAQRGSAVPSYIADPCVNDEMYNRMTDDEARHATSSVLSRRQERERLAPPGARGDHIARKRVALEVSLAPDPERRVAACRPLNRSWKCCCCPFEFDRGEESETIHFCSFDGCQHVMCAEHAHTVGLSYVKFPGQNDLVFGHYFCWHHKHSD